MIITQINENIRGMSVKAYIEVCVVITPCSLVGGYQLSGGTCCIRFILPGRLRHAFFRNTCNLNCPLDYMETKDSSVGIKNRRLGFKSQQRQEILSSPKREHRF